MIVKFKKLDPRAVMPAIAYDGDVGLDLTVIGSHLVAAHSFLDLPTGLAMEMPPGHWCLLKGRSSTIRKVGLMVTDGVIDAGYRGPLFVGVFNPTHNAIVVAAGSRLAQAIPHRSVMNAEWRVEEVDELSPTSRGANGFGSSGR